MKKWILAALCLAALTSKASSLESQLEQPGMYQKMQNMAHVALGKYYYKTWDHSNYIGYDMFGSSELLSIDKIRCLPTKSNTSGVCLVTIGYDPYNGIEFAELALTVGENGSMDMVVLTQKDGPRFE